MFRPHERLGTARVDGNGLFQGVENVERGRFGQAEPAQ